VGKKKIEGEKKIAELRAAAGPRRL